MLDGVLQNSRGQHNGRKMVLWILCISDGIEHRIELRLKSFEYVSEKSVQKVCVPHR